MLWKEFVKQNYDKVRHLPNTERLKALAVMHKKVHKGSVKKSKVKGGLLSATEVGNHVRMNWYHPDEDVISNTIADLWDTGINNTNEIDTILSNVPGWNSLRPREEGAGLMRKPKKSKVKKTQMQSKSQGGALEGDIPELDAQGAAKSVEELLKPVKMPSQMTRNIQPSSADIQKAQDLQAKNPWAPYKVPYDYAEGYPVFFFQHPNKWSANPNEVLLYSTLDRFMESDIYAKLKDKLKKIAGKYSGYSGGNRDGSVLPFKKFRLIFRSKSPDDRSEYVYDAVDKDDYLRVLDMSKDSNFIIPVELASKAFMDSNAKQAVSQSQNARDLWKLGFQEASKQWKQNIQDATEMATAQQEYFTAKQKREAESSDIPSWLKTVGSVALDVAPLLL